MKRAARLASRAASVAIAAALLLGRTRDAHAGGSRVVVAGPEGDAIASRLQKELTAMGFESVRVDEAAGCAPGAVAAWVDEMKASAAACSDGTGATVWISTKSGLHVAEVVAPREGDAHADVVAVRAAEITRASLELSTAEPEPATRPAPTWRNTTPPGVDVTTTPRKRGASGGAAPRTPAFAMGTGISALMGADVTAAALDTELELRLARYVGLSARAALTFDGAPIATSRSVVRVAPSIFGLGPVVALAGTDSFFIPRIGGGAGVVWLRSSAAVNGAGSGVSGRFGPSDSIVSPMGFLSGAVSMRVGGPLRLTLEGLIGTSAHRMVVRAQGEEVAYWGEPFGTVALRAELMYR